MNSLILISTGTSLVKNLTENNEDLRNKIRNTSRDCYGNPESEIKKAVSDMIPDLHGLIEEISYKNMDEKSAELKSLKLFIQEKGQGWEQYHLIFLASHTFEGILAAELNLRILQSLFEERVNAEIKVIEGLFLSEYSNDNRFKYEIDEALKSLRYIIEDCSKQLYEKRYICLSGGFKLFCIRAWQYAKFANEVFDEGFAYHENSNKKVFWRSNKSHNLFL